MFRIIRFLAVIALALSPVWGVPSVHAASSSAPSYYPVWPNFESDGCSAVPNGNGGTSLACGTGGFALTQLNSGYSCNEIDISVSDFSGASFTVVGTAQSGSVSNTVIINGNGNYYMQFPFFLTNNLITLQIGQGTGGGGSMSINSIYATTCVAPTSSPTPNPSFTATNTPVPVTGTPTPIPTYTPLPSGHSTFTPTNTPPAGSTSTATGTATASPTPGPAYRNCGDATFPLLNCDGIPGNQLNGGPAATYWTNGGPNSAPTFKICSGQPTQPYLTGYTNNISTYGHILCYQSVTAHASGTLFVRYNYDSLISAPTAQLSVTGNSSVTIGDTGCAVGSSNYCIANLGSVTNGITYTFNFIDFLGSDSTWAAYLYMDNVWVQATSSPTPATPIPATSTDTAVPATDTLTPTGPTSTPTETPIPIPGAMSTAIPTATECPGGCAVAALTQIPGLATRVLVDTSPFSPLENLSLTRSSCAPFGYMQIPMPVIIGTPAYGSTTPLSYTWTTPITGPWDNSIVNGSIVVTNTAIQPCAMSEIPTFTWDLTYWLSVIMLAVGWFLWLIGFVGRLSGEETING